MKNSTVKGKGSARLFKNPSLEMLTRTNPWFIYILYTGLAGTAAVYYYRIINPNPAQTILFFFIGVVGWTLTEYLMHRYLFHWLNGNKLVKRFHYIVHGCHHEYPRDKERLIMPPLPSIIFSSLFFLLFYGVMGDFGIIYYSGFMTGYLAYISIHYSIHAFKPPKNKYLNYVWKHHNLHHFRYPEKAFGVSSPLWDYVFGTMPDDG